MSELKQLTLQGSLMYIVRTQIRLFGRELLEFLGMSRLSQSDDLDANQLIALLKLKDEELQAILSKGLTI